MSIDRSAPYGTLSDDSGSGLDGTVFNNAWWQGVLDRFDARWSRATVASVGTQTVINPTEADLLLCNNATDLTIRSITAPSSPAKPGKVLAIRSIGAGHVFLNHEDTSGTTAAYRMHNFTTSGATPLALSAGMAVYQYDDNASRWVLRGHEQGSPIAWTPADASGASLALTVTGAVYYLRGRSVTVSLDVTYPATANASAAKLTNPYAPIGTYNGALATGYTNQGSAVTVLVRQAGNFELAFVSGSGVTNANMSGKNIIASGTYFTT
jgi:hypothetical protein